MAEKNKSFFCIQDQTVYVDFSEKNTWEISTKVTEYEEVLRDLKQSTFRWQNGGAYLWIDPETSFVYLKQEVDSAQRYLRFKYLMRDFIDTFSEWKEMLLCK